MKICPNCNSVLADNEPYCENCGYDPDVDGGGWLPDSGSLQVPEPHGQRYLR